MCVRVCIYVHPIYRSAGTQRVQERVLGPLGLGLQMAVSGLARVLGTELQSSERIHHPSSSLACSL